MESVQHTAVPVLLPFKHMRLWVIDRYSFQPEYIKLVDPQNNLVPHIRNFIKNGLIYYDPIRISGISTAKPVINVVCMETGLGWHIDNIPEGSGKILVINDLVFDRCNGRVGLIYWE